MLSIFNECKKIGSSASVAELLDQLPDDDTLDVPVEAAVATARKAARQTHIFRCNAYLCLWITLNTSLYNHARAVASALFSRHAFPPVLKQMAAVMRGSGVTCAEQTCAMGLLEAILDHESCVAILGESKVALCKTTQATETYC